MRRTAEICRMRRAARAAAAALLLAGCSSAPAPTDTPPPAQHGSLAECLRANFVPEPDAGAAVLDPPAGVDQNTWDAAVEACSTLAPGPAAP